jgi:hypothetical protein
LVPNGIQNSVKTYAVPDDKTNISRRHSFECGSGLLLGVTVRAGVDIDALGLVFLRPYATYKDDFKLGRLRSSHCIPAHMCHSRASRPIPQFGPVGEAVCCCTDSLSSACVHVCVDSLIVDAQVLDEVHYSLDVGSSGKYTYTYTETKSATVETAKSVTDTVGASVRIGTSVTSEVGTPDTSPIALSLSATVSFDVE